MKYALINGKILNGHQDMEVETGKTIFIENEKIVAIEPYRNLDKSYQIIDLQGKYILPGLINMHVHLAGNGKPQKKQKDNEKTVKMLMSNPLSRKITYKVVSNFAKIELMSWNCLLSPMRPLGLRIRRLADCGIWPSAWQTFRRRWKR